MFHSLPLPPSLSFSNLCMIYIVQPLSEFYEIHVHTRLKLMFMSFIYVIHSTPGASVFKRGHPDWLISCVFTKYQSLIVFTAVDFLFLPFSLSLSIHIYIFVECIYLYRYCSCSLCNIDKVQVYYFLHTQIHTYSICLFLSNRM